MSLKTTNLGKNAVFISHIGLDDLYHKRQFWEFAVKSDMKKFYRQQTYLLCCRSRLFKVGKTIIC